MGCDKCNKFPAPTNRFEEVATSIERFGTLYKCKFCGAYYELIEMSRSVKELTKEQAEELYDLRC